MELMRRLTIDEYVEITSDMEDPLGLLRDNEATYLVNDWRGHRVILKKLDKDHYDMLVVPADLALIAID